jgi:hypothetical protein
MGSANVTPTREIPGSSSSSSTKNATRLCPQDFHKAVAAKCAKIKKKSLRRAESLPVKIK